MHKKVNFFFFEEIRDFLSVDEIARVFRFDKYKASNFFEKPFKMRMQFRLSGLFAHSRKVFSMTAGSDLFIFSFSRTTNVCLTFCGFLRPSFFMAV